MNRSLPRRSVAVLLAAAVAVLASSPVAADYPEKPVRVLIGYPPGGPTDIIGRLVTDQMAASLGGTIVVDNRPGAGSNLATQALATAAPDGYTLLIASFANAVNPAMMQVPYDSRRDLAPVSMLARIPVLVVAPAKAPYSTVAELIAAAKARPGALNYATGGIGSSSHLAAEFFKRGAGVDIVTVHYKGGAPALQDLLAGRVDLMFDNPQTSMPHVKEGRVKLLAVTPSQRLSWLPNVPTVAESGLPGFDVITWVGLFARSGTPAPIVDRLHQAVVTAVASPKVTERFREFGIEAVGNRPAEFTAFFHGELDRWARLVREANIKVE